MSRLAFILVLFTLSNVALSQHYEIKHLDTDLKNSVFSPAYWTRNLVVCCNQKDRINKTVLDKHGHEPIDLYVIDPFNTDSSTRFDQKFRTLYHDGPATYNGPGDYLAISRNLKTDQKYKSLVKEENHLGIYFSSFENNEWSDLEEFPFNDTSYNCSHPCLNYDGYILYFASDMPGGYGGYDIWKSRFVNGQWQKPSNLGPTINTENDELFPYAYGINLYFSSDRGVYGGLDLYQATLINDDRETRILEEGLNTKADDFGLITSNSLETGFLSSNRDGVDQIYSFEFIYPEFDGCDSLVKTTLCYEITEQNYYEFGGAEALIYEWHINEDTVQGFVIDYCFPDVGGYEISLDVIDTIVNQTYYEQSYYYLEIKREVQPYIEAPDTVTVNEFFQLSADDSNLPEMTLSDEDYYWFLSDGTKYRGVFAVHQFLAPGIYEIKLGVVGESYGEKATDCSYRTIVCLDENGNLPDTTPVLVQDDSENLRDKSNDLEVMIYTIELQKSDDLPKNSDFNFSLIDPNHDHNLSIVQEDEAYITFFGTFKDSIEAYQYLYKLIQMGYDDAQLKKIALDELENFNLSIDDFFAVYNDLNEQNPNLFEDSENVNIENVKHFYTQPGDSAMVVFSIEVARSETELDEDHFIFRLLEPYGDYELKYIEEDEEFVYLFGSFSEFDEGHKYFKELQQFGLEDAVLRSFNIEDISDFELNQTFVLNNIQFDSDKWNIRADAEIELKKVVQVLRFFPELEINISAHTDATASNSYNLGLSKKRALSVKKYLVAAGIDANRISYEGYGEEEPIDSNETEEGKQNNRRVEFTLSKKLSTS